MIRLQAFLSHAGVASRRESEKIILSGRVCVNGAPVTEMGVKVGEDDSVMLDGREIKIETRLHYLALNKPPLYLCASSDDENRPLAKDLLPREVTERLYNVGRLDFRSSGLILFTNDGDFAAKLMHPSSEIEKEYYVEATNIIPESLLEAFRNGINIEDVFYKCKEIKKVAGRALRIILIEGKNREIRKIFSHFHLHLKVLRRIRIGNVLLDDLAEGKTRPLSQEEMAGLNQSSRQAYNRMTNCSGKPDRPPKLQSSLGGGSAPYCTVPPSFL